MKRNIYKYEIPMVERFTLRIPKDARFLTIQINNGKPCMWFDFPIQEQNLGAVTREFQIVGTGEGYECDELDHMWYLGTFQRSNGFATFVFHVYERISRQPQKENRYETVD